MNFLVFRIANIFYLLNNYTVGLGGFDCAILMDEIDSLSLKFGTEIGE